MGEMYMINPPTEGKDVEKVEVSFFDQYDVLIEDGGIYLSEHIVDEIIKLRHE